jgi:hypothetical protein
MRQLSSVPRCKDHSRKGVSSPFFCSLVLGIAIGLTGCKPAERPAPPSPKVVEKEPADTPDLEGAITDLRTQNVQLRQALETALDAQEQLTNQVRQAREDLRKMRDDLALVREELRDLELDRETKPVEPSSNGMTAEGSQ